MAAKSSSNAKKNNVGASAKQKGSIVEEIVAMMHRQPGVEVKRNVRLPAKNYARRHREIDVLLLGSFAGYPTILAIECKNFKRRINVRDIGEFKDRLDDVGLAPQQGILISVSKIGAGALSRARELGIKAFQLRGLTADRLSAAIHEAGQFVIFVVPAMSHLSVQDNLGPDANWTEIGTFLDQENNIVGLLPDLLWHKWLEGAPPSVLGEHNLELEVPEGWHRRVEGRHEPVHSIFAKVKVHAAVVKFAGTGTGHALLDPSGPKLQKYQGKMSFDTSPGEYPVHNFSDEHSLEAFLQEQKATFTVTVGRVRVPRIIVNHIYWPPSERVMQRVREFEIQYEAGEMGMPDPEFLKGIEDGDLSTLWESIAVGYPAAEYLRKQNGE